MTEIKEVYKEYVRIDGKEPAFTKEDDIILKILYKVMGDAVGYFDKY